MTPKQAKIAILGAILGLHTESALSSERQWTFQEMPPEIQSQLEALANEGIVSVNPRTGRITLHLDIADKLRREGKLKVRISRGGQVCQGGPQ